MHDYLKNSVDGHVWTLHNSKHKYEKNRVMEYEVQTKQFIKLFSDTFNSIQHKC